MKVLRMALSAALVLLVVVSGLAFKVKTNPNVSECVNHWCELRNYSDFKLTPGQTPVNPPFNPHTGTGQCDVGDGNDTCLPTLALIYINS